MTKQETKPVTTARSIGTATISLGLVAVPIKLLATQTAARELGVISFPAA